MLGSVRFVRLAVLGSLLVAIGVSLVLAGRSPSSPQSLSGLFGGGEVATEWGPLSPSDRDMLIKLRQADLFDGPCGDQAGQRALASSVRRAGNRLGQTHAQLDAQLLATANQLGVALPNQPSDQQSVWRNAIASAPATSYDASFVNLLRAAYGELLPQIEGVRSGTQNQLIRHLAITASARIEGNMQSLERTGEVNYALLAPSTAPAARLTAIGGYVVPITLLLFLAAVVVGAMMLRGLRLPAPGGAGAGLVAKRLSGLFGKARDKARERALRSARQRRADRDRMVTTAELIAVLKPVDPDAPASRAGLDTEITGMPHQRRASAERLPPKLGRTKDGRGW